MLRRILYISFVLALIAGVGYFYWSYQKKSKLVTTFSEFATLPANTTLLITVNSLEDHKAALADTSEMLMTLKRIPLLGDAAHTIKKLDTLLQNNRNLKNRVNDVTFHFGWDTHNKSYAHPLIVLALPNTNLAEEVWDSFVGRDNLAAQATKIKGRDVFKLQFPELRSDTYYAFFEENAIVLSSDLSTITKSIDGLENSQNLAGDTYFNKIQHTAGKQSPVNLYINLTNISAMVEKWGSEAKNISYLWKNIGSWVEVDLNLQHKSIMLNGFGNTADEHSFFSMLQPMEPVEYTSPEVLPISVGEFIIMGIHDVGKYRASDSTGQSKFTEESAIYQKLETWNNVVDTNLTVFFDEMLKGEICAVYNAQISNQDSLDRLIVLKLESSINAEEDYNTLLSRYAKSKELKVRNLSTKIQADYKTEVYSYNFPFVGLLSHLYGEAINDKYLERVCFYKNYMFLAYNHEAIQNVIFENVRERTLINDQNYKEFASNIAQHANFFWFTRMPNWESKIGEYLNDSTAIQLGANGAAWSKFYGLGLQLTSLNNLIYSTAYLQYKPEVLIKPKTIWERKLNAEINMKPFWVVNHYTGEKEVCVQDESNKLYLINNQGIVLWEKQLDSPIVGAVEQIDLFKNGKLQLLFSTQNKLVLLDRNGNYVGRYPVNFAAKTTVGASLHDYNGRKDYRIFVPCENGKVYLYDKNGQLVRGWTFNRTDHWVNQPVKHFRADNRDFIVFKDKSRVYIQDRRGRTRVKPKVSFTPSVNSEIFLDRSTKVGRERFVTTDENGVVKFIHVDGTVREQKLISCTPEHTYVFDDVDGDGKGDHLFMDQGNLVVFRNDGTKIFEKLFKTDSLSGPALYTFGPKNIKIGITDIQNERIYLFNIDGTQYEGFPVSGVTDFSIGFMSEADWRFGLVAGGKSGYVLYYKIK